MSADNFNFVRKRKDGRGWDVWTSLSASSDREPQLKRPPDATYPTEHDAVLWADAQGYTEYGTEVDSDNPMTPIDEAVALAGDVILRWQETGIGDEAPDEAKLARAVLELHAEVSRLKALAVKMTEEFLGPDADEHKRNLLRAVKLHTNETDQLRAGLKEALALWGDDAGFCTDPGCPDGHNDDWDRLAKLAEGG